jgi:hypothetical protein
MSTLHTNQYTCLSYFTQFFLDWWTFQIKYVQKIKTHIFCSTTFFFQKSCHLWDNVEKHREVRPQMTIWHMHIACWIPKVTNMHSQYVILIAVLLWQWLHKHSSVSHSTYTACLVNFVHTNQQAVQLERNKHYHPFKFFLAVHSSCVLYCT